MEESTINERSVGAVAESLTSKNECRSVIGTSKTQSACDLNLKGADRKSCDGRHLGELQVLTKSTQV